MTDKISVPAMVTMDSEDVKTREENHKKDNHDEYEDEGVGAKGAVVEVITGKRT